MLSANLRLLELNTERKARVITAVRVAKQHLFRYQGYVGAYLLIGGVDATGPHLYEVSAGGNSFSKPYAASGSGSYAAISVLERDYKYGIDVSLLIERFERRNRLLLRGTRIRKLLWFFSGDHRGSTDSACPRSRHARGQRIGQLAESGVHHCQVDRIQGTDYSAILREAGAD
jgi:hypothetical protein